MTRMGLKAPSIITFTLSIILVVIAAGSKYAQAHVPMVNGNEIPMLIFAHLLLALGCVLDRLSCRPAGAGTGQFYGGVISCVHLSRGHARSGRECPTRA